METEIQSRGQPAKGNLSQEQSRLLMTVVKPMAWMALLVAGILLATFIFWGIAGEIPTKIHAQGILIGGGGVYNISHTSSGKITDIRVSVGDLVKSGEAIAIIEQDELVKKINVVKSDLKQKQIALNVNSDNSYKNELKDLKTKLIELQAELIYSSTIVSPYDGRVLEIKANKGELLEEGKPVVSIKLLGKEFKDLESILYIAAEEGSQIRPGMDVEIAPNSSKKEEYGYMIAKVISVSEYPVTNQGMMRILGNEELVNKFLGQGPLLEIRAELITKSDNMSGYSWTLSKGPDYKINSGTLCMGEITVSKEMPLKMILSGKSSEGGGH